MHRRATMGGHRDRRVICEPQREGANTLISDPSLQDVRKGMSVFEATQSGVLCYDSPRIVIKVLRYNDPSARH